ncbi:hypothetical protein ACFXKC_37815 [Streptomyces sp. NPDC059340]|uniref:hypothetical protein n=1 Tax=Streptomyces sp. NPDC059340 TaxID=3346806 RepID=UPI00369BA9B1
MRVTTEAVICAVTGSLATPRTVLLGDVARDSAGRWRHPARPHRVRTDVDVAQVPLFGE